MSEESPKYLGENTVIVHAQWPGQRIAEHRAPDWSFLVHEKQVGERWHLIEILLCSAHHREEAMDWRTKQ